MKTSNKILIILLSVIIISIISIEVVVSKRIHSLACFGNNKVVKVSKEISPFSSIKVSNHIHVFFTQGNSFKSIVEADSNLIDEVKISVEDSTLNIFADGFILSKNPLNVYVEGSTLSKISLQNRGKLEIKGLDQRKTVSVYKENGTELFLRGYLDTLNVHANNGSVANIEGTCKVYNVEANNGCRIYADSLTADIANFNLNNGSVGHMHVLKNMSVSANNGSVINYAGMPNIKTQQIHSGSQLKHNN